MKGGFSEAEVSSVDFLYSNTAALSKMLDKINLEAKKLIKNLSQQGILEEEQFTKIRLVGHKIIKKRIKNMIDKQNDNV